MAYQTNLTPDFGYGNPYVDSLIWGCQWTNSPDAYGPVTISTPVDITYSYATGNLYGYRLSAWSIAEVNAFEEAMQFYENVCNLNFTLTTFTSEYEDQSNIVFYQVPENYLGAGYLGMFEVPDGTWTSNYGYFNYQHSSWRSLNKGSYGFITIIHELGHGLGLAHPHDGGSESSATTFPGVTNNADVGLYGLNQGIWTTMSYIDGWDAFASSTNDYGYQSTPMAFDVAALQAIYGVNTSFRTGSDTYYLPTSNTSGTGWSCIWDAGGTDTISNEGSSIDSTIELYAASLTGENAGGFVSKNAGIIGGFTIANGVVIENAIGGEGNDSITGNDANNQLQGGNGNDIMYGGGGNDTFDWDSAKRSGNDTIYGGLGDDTYVLDSSSDIVIEYLDEGTDTVWTDFSFSLTSCLNVEGLYLTGIGNITATGNNLSNLLRGNSGNNFLIGNEGLDTFIFNTNANGVDTISDIAVGEIIQILGANFSEAVTEGDGSSAGLNQIQIERSGGITTLNIGTDSVMGADTIILLTGNYRASQFFGSGQTITFSAYTNSLPTGAVSISGTARQGQVLTASNTLADIDGLGTITYQWRANGINISAATDPTYTLTQAEVGAVITVVARYTDPFGSAESMESGASQTVEAVLYATYSNPISSIDSIGVSPDGGYLLIKVDGVTQSVPIGSSLSFNGRTVTTSDLTSSITVQPVFQSSGGSNGYALPEVFTGQASLNLDYQLIETADNAVVIGGSTNDFIKVASTNSVGKAVDGRAGDDVIDGGAGSSFISGGAGNNTIFLDGRLPDVSWSTVADFKFGQDKATIWGWKAGVSRVSTIFTDFNTGGAAGYTGLTLHFENLLPDDAPLGQTNSNFNSITLTGLTLADFGATSLADLNAQINAGTNSHFIVGQTVDAFGEHGYLLLS
jgi:serralysin